MLLSTSTCSSDLGVVNRLITTIAIVLTPASMIAKCRKSTFDTIGNLKSRIC